MSKILEKIVKAQIYQYIVENNILLPCQSGFRKDHGTATVLVHVSDDIIIAYDDGKATALLLDYSKAFEPLILKYC